MVHVITYDNIENITSFIEAITNNFPSKRCSSNSILVESALNSKEILSKLDASGSTKPTSTILIIPLTQFYARFSTDVWDWLKEKNAHITIEEKN